MAERIPLRSPKKFAELYLWGFRKQNRSFADQMNSRSILAISTTLDDLLLSKAIDVKNELLHPGEYERLVRILQTKFPKQITTWIQSYIVELRSLESDPRFRHSNLIREIPKECIPLFKANMSLYNQIQNLIVFV